MPSLPKQKNNLLGYFRPAAVSGGDPPTTNSAPASFKTSAVNASASSETSAPSSNSTSFKTSVQSGASFKTSAPTRPSLPATKPASGHNGRTNASTASSSKRSSDVIELSSDDDEPAPRAVEPILSSDEDTDDLDAPVIKDKRNAAKRQRKVEPDSDSEDDNRPLRKKEPVSSGFRSKTSVPSFTVAPQKLSAISEPSSFHDLIVKLMTLLLAFANAHLAEVSDELTVDLLVSLYTQGFQAASQGAFDYIDTCVRANVPWNFEHLLSLLPDASSLDKFLHGAYFIRLNRTHADRAGHSHSYGGSATSFSYGLFGRIIDQHFYEPYRVKQLKISPFYLYRLWGQSGVHVDAIGKIALKLCPSVTAKYGRLPCLIFETANQALFTRWRQDLFPEAAPSRILGSKLFEAFRLKAAQLTDITNMDDQDVMIEALGSLPTNNNVPMLEEVKLSRIEKLKRSGEVTVQVYLHHGDSFRMGLLPGNGSRILGLGSFKGTMLANGFSLERPQVSVKVYLSESPVANNFAGVPEDFVNENLPDVSALVMEISWLDHTNTLRSAQYKRDASPKGEGSNKYTAVLQYAIMIQSLWDFMNDKLPLDPSKLDKWRIDLWQNSQNQLGQKAYNDSALAAELLSAMPVETGKKHYCKACNSGPLDKGKLFKHLGLSKVEVPKSDGARVRRLRICRKPYLNGAPLSKKDVAIIHGMDSRYIAKQSDEKFPISS